MDMIDVIVRKQLGGLKPNGYLSNVAISFFETSKFASRRLFPICPVQVPSGFFYEFSRADLARDGVQRKPDFGKVAPTVLGHAKQSYSCHVDQILIGIDKLLAMSYQRMGGSDESELYRVRSEAVAEQIALHQEIDFAQNFFKQGVWANEWSGAATANAAQKKFLKFDNDKCDAVRVMDDLILEVKQSGRRKPNKLALGVKAFNALKNNPSVKERVKFSGTTQNPAVVNENVLAQIFGLESVVVLDATYNAAPVGSENLTFICDPSSALLIYAPNAPAIDLPSAGYCFSLLLSGNDYLTISLIDGQDGTHADFLEGLVAYDLRKTSDALGVFMYDCCG